MQISLMLMVMNLFRAASSAENEKRVLFGYPVYSQDEWNTEHVVVLVRTWACVTNQIEHVLGGCKQRHFCTGSLLTLDFVITAGHCVAEQILYAKENRRTGQELYRVPNSIGFQGLFGNPLSFVVKARIHRFYASVAILAGSPEIAKMNQKRHLEKVFPHPNYIYEEGKFSSKASHDIAIVRVCEKFKNTKYVKPAPMMRLDELRPHWDSIVKRNAACLMAGFGDVEDPNDYSKEIGARTLHFTWGYMTCSSVCNRNRSLPFDAYRNPCLACSPSIPPLYGAPAKGDSGGPVICDGFYTAILTGAAGSILLNKTRSVGYVLHCIKNAITTERLAYYRSLDADAELELLGPLEYERRRRHSFMGSDA